MNIWEQIKILQAEGKSLDELSDKANESRAMSLQVLKGLNACPELPEHKEVTNGLGSTS